MGIRTIYINFKIILVNILFRESSLGYCVTDDAIITKNDQKEMLSFAYVQAVTACAGYVTSVRSLDRDGVDLQINAGGPMRPSLDLQLKATVNIIELQDMSLLSYQLKKRNYDLLREETQTPRLLVVLHLPKIESCWMTISEDELVLRYRAYWLDLKGLQKTQNKRSIAVRIPKQNLFNVENLRILMEKSREGRI